MAEELHNYLKSVKANNQWNKEEVVATTKSILNHYMGEPPAEFTYENKKYSPAAFVKDVLKLDMKMENEYFITQ